MKLQKHERQAIKAVKKLAKSFQIDFEVIGHDGKCHLRMRLSGRTQERVLRMSSSPTNTDHTLKNVQKEASRLLLEIKETDK